eukprot:scaffold84966_cov68-Phaeocystis_antarctica.AAC.3
MAVLDNDEVRIYGGAMSAVTATARRMNGSSSLSGGSSIKKFRAAGRGGSREPAVGGSTSCLAPSLKSELTALADRHAQSPPPEIFVLFPNWTTELPQILHSQSAAQLKVLLAALDAQAEHEPELTAAYAFASAALREALGVHVSLGTDSSPPCQRSGDGAEEGELVKRLILGAPECVHETFPNFELELRGALLRPLAELRGAARRMEAAQASLEVRRFTEDLAEGGDAQLAREADAMGFAVRAMFALVSLKASTACEHEAEALGSDLSRGSEPAGSSADSSTSSSSSSTGSLEVGAFCFHSFFAKAKAEASGDLFNPCCEGIDVPAVARRASALGGGITELEVAWRGPWSGAQLLEPPLALPSLLALDNHSTLLETPAVPQPLATNFSTLESTFAYATTTKSSPAHRSATVVAHTRRRPSAEDEMLMRVVVAESCGESFRSTRMDSPNRITDDLLCS